MLSLRTWWYCLGKYSWLFKNTGVARIIIGCTKHAKVQSEHVMYDKNRLWNSIASILPIQMLHRDCSNNMCELFLNYMLKLHDYRSRGRKIYQLLCFIFKWVGNHMQHQIYKRNFFFKDLMTQLDKYNAKMHKTDIWYLNLDATIYLAYPVTSLLYLISLKEYSTPMWIPKAEVYKTNKSNVIHQQNE